MAISGTNLGDLVATYGPTARERLLVPALAVAGPLVAAALAIAAHQFPEIDEAVRSKAVFLVPLAFVFSAFMMVSWWKRRGLVVQVHQRGFAKQTHRTTQVCRWEDVAEVWRSIFEGERPRGRRPPELGYTVVQRNGRKIELPKAVANLDDLGRRLEAVVAERLLADAIARFDAGHEVILGDYKIDREGIRVLAPTALSVLTGTQASKIHEVKWSELSGRKHERQWLRLLREGTDWYMPYTAVPNWPILTAILDRQLR